MTARRPVRIANCSGFYGDRLGAAREMVEGGPIDVLTGDWLAELTMLIMARTRLAKGPGTGYARTFLTAMDNVLGTCLERGIRVVVNAGGLDPQGCAEALLARSAEHQLAPRIAYVLGDDLVPRWDQLRADGEEFVNIDTGERYDGNTPMTANAYLGGRGITATLAAGADVVITGRVTDAALAIGPAAWWHGWSYDDPAHLDALAGALVAGHVIECGAQATGGNYAFYDEIPGYEHLGFPWADIAADGSAVIGKHGDGTGGRVNVGTVTAQLLYEIAGPAYFNPDVVADFTSFTVAEAGRDRVAISTVRGHAPPDYLKVAVNTLGGLRNSMTLVVTGLDIEGKADIALRSTCGVTLEQAQTLDPAALAATSTVEADRLDVELLRYDRLDPTRLDASQAHLRIIATGTDPDGVGRRFSAQVIAATLASYPGMFPTTMPGDATPFGSYWPTTIPAHLVTQDAFLLDPAASSARLATTPSGGSMAMSTAMSTATGGTPSPIEAPKPLQAQVVPPPDGQMARVPLGTFVGARSGDKGGNANIGLWVRRSGTALDDLRYEWLGTVISPDGVRQLLPEAAGLDVEVHRLPNMWAVNVVIHGLLGRGVAETTRLDPQAKGLGEHLRARHVDVPLVLLTEPGVSR